MHQPPLIKKVQWSTFENQRGDDVMSTSFWFQGVPCVACFVVCPHVVFKFGFACRVAGVWVRIRLRQCAMCVHKVFGVRHTFVVVLPSECQVVQHGCTLR